jgi:SAM-dependent methyltransferase
MPEPLELGPAYYDLFADWPRRLAHEGPFYQRLFASTGARRVLDAACGTGRHLILFSQWGREVTGSDANPEMIDRARAAAVEAEARIDFFVARFAELPEHVARPFDLVVCVGNALSMVPEEEVEASVKGLAAAVRPGGVLVLQVLNAQRYGAGTIFSPLRSREREGRPVLFQKIYVPREGELEVHFLIIERGQDGAWRTGVDSNRIANRPPERLRSLLGQVGFNRLDEFGGYAGEPFGPEATDFLVVAHRAPR